MVLHPTASRRAGTGSKPADDGRNPRRMERPILAKKPKTTTTKAPARKATGTKSKSKQDRVPQQAENFEHTIRRVVRERDRYRSDKYGLYL